MQIAYFLSDIYYLHCANNDGSYLHCANSNSLYLHYVKITIFSTIFILLIANSGNYLHLGVVVHYKTVRNNNILSVNYSYLP